METLWAATNWCLSSAAESRELRAQNSTCGVQWDVEAADAGIRSGQEQSQIFSSERVKGSTRDDIKYPITHTL
ncbi:hypothetical protein E2C01_033592 [Portunus trituberculatus]|uniref:Uncharacterized protein n=1 Tax=Portunus trituberculatus TaxID=210409 RepID=A0A5B7F3B9_PORTR|nr:hypothetical protein [Portunus trituberculatus]